MGDPFLTTKAVHGQNPENLIETILKQRIFRNNFWKEKCYGLTAATLTEVAIELPYFGGTFGGNGQPTPFMCLLLAMLQIQPEKEIVVEYIKNEDYKYVRALGAFYLRLVGSPVEIYQYLEPLYYDYRKLRKRTDTGYQMVHMDEYIDELLWETHCCSIALPFLPRRWVLEGAGQLEPRVSLLEDDLEKEIAEEEAKKKASRGDDSDSGSDLERSYKERSRRERWRRPSRSSKERRSRSRSGSESPSRRRRRRSHSRDSGKKRRYSSRSRSRSPSSSTRNSSSRRRSSRHREDCDGEDYRGRRSSHSSSRHDSRQDDYDSRSRRSHREDRHDGRGSDRNSRRSRDNAPAEAGEAKKGNADSMSIDETNALRAKLGLAPLK